jgi:replicative DNA helicase
VSDPAWDVERGLLGGLLLDPTQIEDVGDLLLPDDFHRPQHGDLFRHLTRLVRGGPVDLSIVLDDLTRRQAIEAAGGASYVAALPNACPSVEFLPAYAARIRETATRRRLRALFEAGAAALDDGEDLLSVTERAESRIADLRKAAVGKDDARFVPIADLVKISMDRALTPPADDAPVTMLLTGYGEIDRRVIGLSPGDLVILAARSGMGKTAAALNIAVNMARAGHGVAIHSSEMTADANVRRMLCLVGRASAMQLKGGRLDDENMRRLVMGAEVLSDLPIAIDDRSNASLSDLRARLSRIRWRGEERTAVLFIDYLQLLRAVSGRGGTRETEVSQIARGLKDMAKELGIVIVALSQIARGVEQRADKRPSMSDLRESGEIEQAADTIFLLYRDDYYHPDTPQKGICEWNIAKQRDGKTGVVPVRWEGDHQLFVEMDATGWTPAPVPSQAPPRRAQAAPAQPAAPAPKKQRAPKGGAQGKLIDPDDESGPLF